VSLLTLSRWQFAVTVMFHMTFPAITVGTSILLCVLYGMYWKTQKPVYLQMFRFWRRIFAVGFAIGVVAGIVITFEFGLDWGVFAAKTGPIMGPILGMEVVTAFFVEAGFIGILLYGDGRVRPPTMFAAAVMVSLGTILSSTWIIANNSWMQTPSGFVVRDSRFEPVNWLHVIFSPSFLWSWYHMRGAVLVSASFFVAGIGAWYLVKGRALLFARRSVSIGLGIAAIVLPLQIFLGDHLATHVLPGQLPKLEAIEGNWASGNIAIARAFLRDADLWVLDEPTAHLDHDAEAQVIDALRAATQGWTVIMATHSVALARSADTVLTIVGGTVRPAREVISA